MIEPRFKLSDFKWDPNTRDATANAIFDDGSSRRVRFKNARAKEKPGSEPGKFEIEFEYDSFEWEGDRQHPPHYVK